MTTFEQQTIQRFHTTGIETEAEYLAVIQVSARRLSNVPDDVKLKLITDLQSLTESYKNLFI